MRTRLKSEQVFYDTLKRLIENVLINDPNFKGETDWSQSWYAKNNKLHYGLFVEKAKYILEEIESLKHLILEEDYLTFPDIRNKLTPITNMIELFERGEYAYIKNKQLEQVKKSINYLTDRDTYELP